eukprot:SAG31_NODE_8490_length_1441_cov_5.464232_1_plen_110_part_00
MVLHGKYLYYKITCEIGPFGTSGGYHDESDGSMLICSLHIVELYINLSRELATQDYTYGTNAQLQWAINYLYTHHLGQIQDPDTFANASWVAKTSSLDPADREVTQYIA